MIEMRWVIKSQPPTIGRGILITTHIKVLQYRETPHNTMLPEGFEATWKDVPEVESDDEQG